MDALPPIQRECLILSLHNVTRDWLKVKARWLRVQAVTVASMSACTGAIPIPAVGATVDAVLIAGTVTAYFEQIGVLDRQSSLFDKYTDVYKRYKFQHPQR